VAVDGGDDGHGCPTPGWDGEVSLVDGRLQGTTTATTAYLYLETEAGRWMRVPADGAVPRTRTGFDFSAHLPPLDGAFAVSAWGWAGGDLVHIGDASYEPPSGGTTTVGDGATGVLLGVPGYVLPPVTLRWIEQSATAEQPEVLSTGGVIDVDANGGKLGTYRFRWSVPFGGVTHGIVQVGAGPFPTNAGPLSASTLATCIVAGSGGEFVVDLDAGTCTKSGQPPVTVVAKDQGTYGAIVASSAGIGGAVPDLVGEVDPLAEIEQQLYGPEAAPSDGAPWTEQLVVRVVPMTNDSWNGKLSNEVAFEVDRTPTAPPGVPAYGMDVQLVTAPRAPDFRYGNCWELVGWQDPAAATQAADAEVAPLLAQALFSEYPVLPNAMFQPHYFWSEFTAQVKGPICAGCYHVGFTGLSGATVGLGGADCSSSSFWSDPVGWVVDNLGAPIVAVIKAIVDLAANGFAKLKGLAVDALLTITQCSGEWCTAIAEAVVNGALIAIGVPPTLPNFDQLVQAGKGELVDLAVDLAKAAGVPCDEVGAAATLHGDDDLTCEGAIGALLDEIGSAVNQQFGQIASAGGLHFPPDMIIKPWWAGQPGPAVVDVTITPTKYTAEEQGVTCSAGVLTSASWTAPSTKLPIPGLGTSLLPQTSWQTMAYEIPTWQLPHLATGSTLAYEPATKRYTLYPPVAHPQVTVQREVPMVAPIYLPVQISPYTFFFHLGATFQLHVGSSCAGWETHVYTLDGTHDGALVSVEQGP
jgi:hypothetical protein